MNTNPHVYADVDTITRVHGIGTVWATMLYEVIWNLIDEHGKRGTELPKFDKIGVPTDGQHQNFPCFFWYIVVPRPTWSESSLAEQNLVLSRKVSESMR